MVGMGGLGIQTWLESLGSYGQECIKLGRELEPGILLEQDLE
jgi:hypothetical protein